METWFRRLHKIDAVIATIRIVQYTTAYLDVVKIPKKSVLYFLPVKKRIGGNDHKRI